MNKSLKNRNYWATEKPGFSFASWEIILQYPSDKNSMNKLLNLYKKISEVGEENDIYRVIEKPYKFEDLPTYKYANYLEKFFLLENQLCSIGGGSFVEFDRYSKIAYYDRDNNLKENYIKDVGSLMIETRNIDIEMTPDRFMRKTPPIYISEGYISDVNNYSNHLDTINIYVDLYTDIWFPWLVGILENDDCATHSISHSVLSKAYDNRELAHHHTPRLNKFLSEVYRLVLDYGGEWEIGEEYSPYKKMFTEAGIIVD
ncbi:MAG: hypothetical protein WBB28_13210 [Crinalium sp.]